MLGVKNKPKLDKRQSFASIPCVMPGLEHKRNQNGLVEVTLQRVENVTGKVAEKFFKLPETRPLILDEIGSEVWELINGKRTVLDIVNDFAKSKKLHRRESEIAILEYLKRLVKRKIVHIIVPNAESNSL